MSDMPFLMTIYNKGWWADKKDTGVVRAEGVEESVGRGMTSTAEFPLVSLAKYSCFPSAEK